MSSSPFFQHLCKRLTNIIIIIIIIIITMMMMMIIMMTIIIMMMMMIIMEGDQEHFGVHNYLKDSFARNCSEESLECKVACCHLKRGSVSSNVAELIC